MNLSHYYWEMRSKYGFGDGNEMPEGIEKVRDLIIKKVNTKLKKNKEFKNIRLAKYDRPGFHNWCMLEFWNKDDCIDPTPAVDEVVTQILSELDEGYQIAEKIVVRPIRIIYDEAGNTYSG